MPFLFFIILALLGWALWTGKVKPAQIPPLLLGIAGFFVAIKGGLLLGVALSGVAAAWYKGLTKRLFGNKDDQSPEYKLSQARHLLGVSAQDDAEKIRARHRKLIAENHPDIGGSAKQASALNDARDLLLAHDAKRKT